MLTHVQRSQTLTVFKSCFKNPTHVQTSQTRELHWCGNGYKPRGNPAGMGTDIKKNPAVMTITGMIFAVIPQERDEFYVEYREH